MGRGRKVVSFESGMVPSSMSPALMDLQLALAVRTAPGWLPRPGAGRIPCKSGHHPGSAYYNASKLGFQPLKSLLRQLGKINRGHGSLPNC